MVHYRKIFAALASVAAYSRLYMKWRTSHQNLLINKFNKDESFSGKKMKVPQSQLQDSHSV